MSVVCGWVAGDFFENTKSLSMSDVVRENLTTALCINSDPSSYVEEKEDGGTVRSCLCLVIALVCLLLCVLFIVTNGFPHAGC